MKNKFHLFHVLMVLPLIIVLITLPIFPDRIPAHYDAAGNINRWGSKYENLIYPAITILMGLFLEVMAKVAEKKEGGSANAKVMYYIGSGTLLLFNGMTVVFLYKAYFPAVGSTEVVDVDIFRVIFMMMGVLLIFMGNIMPKCKMNSTIGLRTKWSMANERSWFLNQRFGGVSFMLTGLLILLGNLLIFEGIGSFIFSMVCLLLDVVVSCVASYIIYKKTI
ncbi:MAG: sdpI [Herbinix sp.]|jgi:uncharacterized membrane protein|nr:sdpI [Herbinix sp.]